MGSEKARRWQRADLNMVVICENRDQVLEDVARKFGAGGMFIATDTHKPVGSGIEVEFELPGLGAHVTIEGRVVYLQDANASQPSGMGIEFEAVMDGLRSQLDRYVHSLSDPDSEH